MIRILHVVASTGSPGGVEMILKNYYSHMDREDIKFDFITHSSNKSELETIFENWGCKIYHVTPKKVNLIQNFKDINAVIKNGNYDIIHNHQNYRGVFSLYLAKFYKVDVRIAQCHLAFKPESLRMRIVRAILTNFLKHNATHWFACGIDAAKWLYGEKTYIENKVRIMKNAIDTEKFAYNESVRKQMRSLLNLDNKFVVGNVGRFHYQKNHEFLIRVFLEVYKRNNNAVLLLIGEGELEQQIRNQVANFNLTESVMFLGSRNDVYKLLQAIDVFLLPSKFEGLPVVLIEAQCSGVKCVVSDNITKEVQVTDNVKYLSLDLSTEKWAETVLCCANYSRIDKSTSIKENGYDIVCEAHKLEQLYKSIIIPK